jgi:uncharacterized membrane protein
VNVRVILDIVTAVCIGLLIGVEFSVSAFINPILHKLDEREELRAIRLFAAILGRVMPFWYVLSLVLLIAEAIVRYRQFGAVLLIVAISIWAAVILLTVLFLVPINNRLATLDPDAPAGAPGFALEEHSRWDAMHRWRVATLTAAMVCFLLAINK